MATTYNSLSGYEFYNDGASGATQIVGNSGDGTSVPRVVRYAFTAPAEGATEISFTKKSIGAYSGSSSTSELLRFYVSDDPNAYVDADATYSYHGTLSLVSDSGYYKATASASNLVLLPKKTYYLFIFPGHTSFGLWYWNYPNEITVTLSGAVGLAQIHNGSGFESYQCYIYNGKDWDLYQPYVFNGTGWDLYSG